MSLVAEFCPRRRKTLKPGLEEWIGYVGPFSYGWEITEEDVPDGVHEGYVGQHAWIPEPCDGFPHPLRGHWVPTEDLDINIFESTYPAWLPLSECQTTVLTPEMLSQVIEIGLVGFMSPLEAGD